MISRWRNSTACVLGSIFSRGRLCNRAEVASLLVVAALSFSAFSQAGSTDSRFGDQSVFARVGDSTISRGEFELAYERERRERFYHGAPPVGQETDFRDEVTNALVMRQLLLDEASKRGITPDADAVRTAVEHARRRFESSAAFKANGDELVSRWEGRYAADSMLAQLQEQVRSTAQPAESELLAYYHSNPDKFIEPAQDRVSLILLGVDPAANKPAWDAMREEANVLVSQLRGGDANFKDLARLRSTDQMTSSAGGDMGYLHRGMLNPQAEKALAALSPGGVTDPVTVLEGVAIFRLDERRVAVLNDYETVRDRVAALWRRDRGDEAWNALQRRLRAATPVVLME